MKKPRKGSKASRTSKKSQRTTSDHGEDSHSGQLRPTLYGKGKGLSSTPSDLDQRTFRPVRRSQGVGAQPLIVFKTVWYHEVDELFGKVGSIMTGGRS